jgi:hypothetical protein
MKIAAIAVLIHPWFCLQTYIFVRNTQQHSPRQTIRCHNVIFKDEFRNENEYCVEMRVMCMIVPLSNF